MREEVSLGPTTANEYQRAKEALAQWRAEHPGSRVTTAEIERRVRTLPSGRVQFSFLVVQY
ncbi:MAG: hypothetical protein UY92_C0004G0021 [Candidatus Magasanikbacteria bacterium GW2011_GWA2_56_11]|uniref:Uncharacterized protein n=1 Tax=Candidatus Magasanikbacteria bacterium GW2011_GWA2_56_11 TaxID=1619044 RepID=A0A0G1YHM1_9BACT|nr:MAG: hypothetical protein UY92_C0004G0021 [Candidatus Magasanikbacteria bacterium GW2011_GWA2_56_11]